MKGPPGRDVVAGAQTLTRQGTTVTPQGAEPYRTHDFRTEYYPNLAHAREQRVQDKDNKAGRYQFGWRPYMPTTNRGDYTGWEDMPGVIPGAMCRSNGDIAYFDSYEEAR